jgi:hypothetical protein
MNAIKISDAKRIREELGATHLVIFAVGADGVQHVATHGETRQHAKQAATAGNNLKKALGWPANLCADQPLPRTCKNCAYWKADWGTHCFNGWSGDGSTGYCKYEPQQIKTAKDSTCHHFEPMA